MNKKIIIVATVLLATVFVSGCINTPLDNINDIMPTLSQNIEKGNLNFNEAVRYSNKQDYNTAEEKVQIASTSFLDAQNNLLNIRNYRNNINDTLYLQYLNLVEEELNLKQNATTNLQLSIQAFKNGDKSLANGYVSKANSLMKQAIGIQNQRENLVKNNPNKFK